MRSARRGLGSLSQPRPPFVIAGALKNVYDLGPYARFRGMAIEECAG